MDKYKELTSKGKDEYLKALEKIGWFEFSNNSKEVIQKKLNEIAENERFVFCLYDLSFDAEGFEDDYSYKSLLNEIFKIIGLKDYKINVEYNKENNLQIAIETKTNVYEYCVDLNETGDWVDESLIDGYIRNILVEEKTNKGLFPIPPEDQTAVFIYISESIYNSAVENGIIPSELGYFMEME